MQLLKTNPALGQFVALQELKRMAKTMVEEAVEEQMRELEKEIMRKFDIIKGGDPVNAGFIDKIVNKAVTQLIADSKGDTGEKGDVGYTPIKGVDFFTEREIQQFTTQIQSRIRIPKDGIDGITPEAGVDYPTNQQVRDEIIKHIPNIPKPENGKTPIKGVDYFTERDIKEILVKLNVPEVTGEQIVKKVNALEITPEKQIDASHIKNLPEFVRKAAKRTLHRGGAAVLWHDLSSELDGVTKTFTIPVNNNNSVMVFSTQFPIIFRRTIDFTISGRTLTLTDEVDAPALGQSLNVLFTE